MEDLEKEIKEEYEKLLNIESAFTKDSAEAKKKLVNLSLKLLEVKGIRVGDIVYSKDIRFSSDLGVFQGVYFENGKVRPRAAKVTKSGKPHSSRCLYLNCLEDMGKYEGPLYD